MGALFESQLFRASQGLFRGYEAGLPYDSPMNIQAGIQQALERIEATRTQYGASQKVALELAVKTRSAEECAHAAGLLKDLGQPILLGHNRVQEALMLSVALKVLTCT